MFALPPNTTHLTQLLDKGLFWPVYAKVTGSPYYSSENITYMGDNDMQAAHMVVKSKPLLEAS